MKMSCCLSYSKIAYQFLGKGYIVRVDYKKIGKNLVKVLLWGHKESATVLFSDDVYYKRKIIVARIS